MRITVILSKLSQILLERFAFSQIAMTYKQIVEPSFQEILSFKVIFSAGIHHLLPS